MTVFYIFISQPFVDAPWQVLTTYNLDSYFQIFTIFTFVVVFMKFLFAFLFQKTHTFQNKITFLVLIQSFSTMHSKTNLEQLRTNMDKIHSFHDIFFKNLQKMSTNNNILSEAHGLKSISKIDTCLYSLVLICFSSRFFRVNSFLVVLS